MLRICALNEPQNEATTAAGGQAETREAQEAHLFTLYNAALQSLADGRHQTAGRTLRQIIASPLFHKENNEEPLAKALRYNVHKNLGECCLAEGSLEQAKDHLLTAADIDDSDVTLWFTIAGVGVKLQNLYLCRSALEQGLRCSPNHWPCLDNVITATFKLGDYLACLGYCAVALERDPSCSKAILYKSKIYNEMPFLQEVYEDTQFVPIPTEPETYTVEPKPAEPLPHIWTQLTAPTLTALAAGLLELNTRAEADGQVRNPVDTTRMLEKCRAENGDDEEMDVTEGGGGGEPVALIRVSVQNLVEEMVDIVAAEQEEETEMLVDEILDDLLCSMFGVMPKTRAEKVAAAIVTDLLGLVADTVDVPKSATAKKSVIVEPKPKGERKRASVFDQIPEELIEKRRSSRKTRLLFESVLLSSDTSNDVAAMMTPVELLTTFLPPGLHASHSSGSVAKRVRFSVDEKGATAADVVKQKLFEEDGAEAMKSADGWFDLDAERREVEKFLAEHADKPVWYLLRYFLDFMFRLDPRMKWPAELGDYVGRIYEEWRIHIVDPLNLRHPEEDMTQEFLRYVLIGNESIVGRLLRERQDLVANSDSEDECNEMDRVDIPEPLRRQVDQDLNELHCLIPHMPVDVVVRIHSLRFYFNCLTDQTEEMEYECEQLRIIYAEHPGIPLLCPNPLYQIASLSYLEDHVTGLARTRELDQLTQYYKAGRHQEIVDLLLATLESTTTMFTPGKDLSRAPNRETQIDILIESLYYVGRYTKCIKWSVQALGSALQLLATEPENIGPSPIRRLSANDWSIVEGYLLTIESCVEAMEEGSAGGGSAYGDLGLDVASRLAASLVDVIGMQIGDPTSGEVAYNSVLPWILLHKLIVWAENRQKTELSAQSSLIDLEAAMPGSLSLLCSGHDYLGQKSCCTLDQGRLLNYILDIFVPILRGGQPLPSYADQLKTNLDQAIFCLFAHPSKKTRAKSLADHNVSQIALTWQRAQVVYRYVKPAKIPEHDDVKLLSISTDLEVFLRRMASLVPDNVEVDKRKGAALRYIQGKTSKLKVKKFARLPDCARDLYYLLADHTFKSKCDMNRAIEYYCLDLSFNPRRFDSWAALALSWANKLDRLLNSCRKLDPAQILDHTCTVQTCFRKCLKLNAMNSNLWIEFGNFSYNIHAYISRTLQNNSEDLTMEMFEILERRKEEILKQALANYEKTLTIFNQEGIEEGDLDERWLLYFMTGKIKEKYGTPIVDCLQLYFTAMTYLKNNKVVVPRKINYDSPVTFTLEALEIYYRVHASTLKYLAKFETSKETLDVDARRKIYEILRQIQVDPLYNTNAQVDKMTRFISERRKRQSPAQEQPAGIELDGKPGGRPESSSPTAIMRDVLEVVDALIEEVEFNLDEEKFSLDNLIRLSLAGLEDVAFHFYHHFKALYRLAHYYHTSPRAKDPQKVQQFLLAAGDKASGCPGLFFGRRPNQVFNDVWRIPINDIDRPGSFATYCCKSLMLLLDVLKQMQDIQTLSDVAIQLRKYPTEENKFLHENDRLEVGTMATTHMINTAREISRRTGVEASQEALMELHKVYVKLAKQWPGKEKELLVPMRDLYATTRERTDPPDRIAAEEVLKFCAQHAAKQKVTTSLRKKMANISAGRLPIVGDQPTAAGSSIVPQQQQPQQPQTGPQQQHTGPQLPVQHQQHQQQMSLLMEVLQQRSQILAYVAKMERFTADRTKSSVMQLPVEIAAAMAGLPWAEQPRELTSLIGKLSSLKPVQLAQIGLSSAELHHMRNFARHCPGIDLQPIDSLLASQKKYESDFTKKFLAASRAGSFSSAAATVAAMPPIKQTVAFKAKQQRETSPMGTKKSVQTIAKHIIANRAGVSEGQTTGNSLAKFTEILGSTGVTITKPGGTVADSSRPACKEAQPAHIKGLDIKKFPHLTISSVDINNKSPGSAAAGNGLTKPSTSRPLTVKSFASLHADSTNITGGNKSPGVGSNKKAVAAAIPSMQQQSLRASVGTGGGVIKAGFISGASGTKSPSSTKSANFSAAGGRKVLAAGIKSGPGMLAAQSYETKTKIPSSKSIAALRDFKAQVKKSLAGRSPSFQQLQAVKKKATSENPNGSGGSEEPELICID